MQSKENMNKGKWNTSHMIAMLLGLSLSVKDGYDQFFLSFSVYMKGHIPISGVDMHRIWVPNMGTFRKMKSQI